MTPDLESLAAAQYVKTDDLLKASPHLAPWRPAVGIAPKPTDAELVTLAVMQAMLGSTSEGKWLRHARAHLRHLFRYLPQQPGYNRRLRKATDLLRRNTRLLATDTSVWSDDVWIVDSTPVECGRSRETVRRSELAGWAEYGYCASHSRFFWGLRLHVVCTLQGLPVAFALTGAKTAERETLLDLLDAGRETLLNLLDAEPELLVTRPGQTLSGDKNYVGRDFEHQLAEHGIRLLRPTRKGEPKRPGAELFKPLRQVIESVNETFKGQLNLEQHHGRTPAGVVARIMQRILTLTTAIRHNDQSGQPVLRSLTANDH
ncbi:IS982 family transposase [Streptomyces sp900105755]|uniref:IS982 family transposase n=1 Tax=Streptomyces sp. 900105755 TaxID=3154389 RepID=UPI0033340D4F